MSSGKESEAGEAAPPSGTEGVLDLSALLGSGDIDIDPEALAGLFGGASFGLDGPVPAAAATEESKSNIWIAASDGDAEKVFSFIDSGVSVNAQDEHGYSTLHAVVGYGHTQLLHRLLAAGADVTLRDSEGDTPLHVCEHTECALVLLEAGADVQAKNDAGQTVRVFVPVSGQPSEAMAWLLCPPPYVFVMCVCVCAVAVVVVPGTGRGGGRRRPAGHGGVAAPQDGSQSPHH